MLALSEIAQKFVPGIYLHYKGAEYEAVRVVHHSETLEELVLYRSLVDNGWWVRPLHMFLENIKVNEEVKPRFKFVRTN